MVDTFIRRPILASVCSLVLILAGAVAIPTMPIAQYPALAPPQVNGHRVLHRRQRAGGRDRRHDPARAGDQRRRGHALHDLVEHQQRRRRRSPSPSTSRAIRTSRRSTCRTASTRRSAGMPAEVRTTGITVQKQSTGFVMAVGVFAEKGEYDSLFLSNYLDVYVKDALKRVPGVGDVIIFGERKYSMRLWLDPDRLAARAASPPATSSRALREQNVQVAAGSVGQAPAPSGQMYQLSVRAVGRLREAAGVRQHHRQERRRRIARAPEGRRPRRARRRDLLARSCGSRASKRSASASSSCRRPTRSTSSTRSSAEMERLSAQFPPGMRYLVAFNTTDVVEESIARSPQDAGRSDRARRPRHLRVPADVAQHDHPGDHHPGLADRRVRVRQADGLLHQHADAVRHHPRHRHRRRRCDRRDREHRAAHPGVQEDRRGRRRPTRCARCSAPSSPPAWC